MRLICKSFNFHVQKSRKHTKKLEVNLLGGKNLTDV